MNARERLRIMIRKNEGSMTVWSKPEIDDAFTAYDAEHRASVLAEVVAWLTKKAREGFPDAAVLASKVARGAVRPDNLRMLPPDFFQPRHTYSEPDGSTDWAFLCDTVTSHPGNGKRTALGWVRFRGQWTPRAYDEDDFQTHLVVDAIGASGRGEGS